MTARELSADLVRCLLREQFPQWAGEPVRPVEVQGWDNRTFRVGDTLSVRLPSAEGYAAAVAKEQRSPGTRAAAAGADPGSSRRGTPWLRVPLVVVGIRLAAGGTRQG